MKAVVAPVLLSWMLIGGSAAVHAAINAATGGIGGINNATLSGGDGTGTAQIEFNAVV